MNLRCLPFVFLLATSSFVLGDDDPVNLSVAKLDGGEGVVLTWAGGVPVYEIFRSSSPQNVTASPTHLGGTFEQVWNDPSSGLIWFYKVAEGGVHPQPPVVSDPLSTDGVGISAPCGGGNCSENLIDDQADTAANRTGQTAVHSGQATLDATDLTLRGRDDATFFAIRRRHMTRVEHTDSIFGSAWAFNYTQTIHRTTSGDAILKGGGRTDVFKLAGMNLWLGQEGRFGRLTYHPTDAKYTLRMAHGTTLVFAADSSASRYPAHLVQLISRNDNRIEFSYETAAQQPDILKRKVLTITESFGRVFEFFYEDPDFPDGASRIREFSGRELIYDYNSDGQLLTVRSPTVTSTGGLNDFPSGKVRMYRYLNHSDPSMKNAISEIVYPNQAAAGARPRFSWTYEMDTTNPFFGYVLTHTKGNPGAPGDLAAGGTYSYSYVRLGPAADLNTATTRTTVTDRRGTITTYDTNRLGHILKEEISTNLNLRPGSPSSYVKTFTYNGDGHVTQRTDALGTTTTYGYPNPFSEPRYSHGNAEQRTRFADSRGGDQASITHQVIYEPVFNRPFKVIDPRGFEPGNTPQQFTRTFIFDYMEDLGAATSHFAPLLGISDAELQDLFANAGITDQASDINGDGLTDRFQGNVIQIRHPAVARPSQAVRVGLGAVEQAIATFRFNHFGQLTYDVDEEDNVTTYEYFGADNPDGNGVTDLPGADPLTGGYLRQIVRDAEPGARRNSGQDPSPVMQTTTYEYVEQIGGFPENLRGFPTSVIDPRGIKHLSLINELDQTVKSVAAADVSASPEVGLSAFAYEQITLLDHDNNVVEVRVQNKDTLDGADDFIVHTFTYDILDQARTETYDAGHLDIVQRHDYDPSQNQIGHTRAVASSDETSESWTWDERDILISHTRGVAAPEESTRTTGIDANGNIVQRFDADGGDVSLRILDGFDRVKEIVNRVGTREIYTYDSASNVVSTEQRGAVDESSSTEVMLARAYYRFDERHRLFREDLDLFQYSGKEVGVIDDGALDPGDGWVSTILLYDRLGRTVGTVDADDDTRESHYDGLSRPVRTIDPTGNYADMTYSPNDNLLVRREVENSPLITDDEEFVVSSTYDSLGRVSTVTATNGQETSYAYDSRHNLIKTIDPLGNEVEMRHDRLDRSLDTRTYLSVNGTGANVGDRDPTQGGGDGMITVAQSCDELGRIATRTDDRGNTTTYTYDDLSRRVRTRYQDGTSEEWTFNADSEVLTYTNQNGSVETWTHDADSRPTQIVVDNSGTSTEVIGTLTRTHGYDGLGRLTRSTDDNGAGEDVEMIYLHDSLSRVIRETQTVGARPGLSSDSGWQGASRLVSQTYPNGRRVDRSYDALDRLSEITEHSDSSLIASFEYVGPRRDIFRTLGNGAVLDMRNDDGTRTTTGANAGFDDNGRTVRHEWTLGDSRITSFLSTFNGANGIGTNRRTSEVREHLSNHQDAYSFDSDYRALAFERNGALLSSRQLDGVDRMTAFSDEGTARNPVVDGVPTEAGMNQYSSIDGVARTYGENSNLVDDGTLLYSYDYQDRLVEIRDATGETVIAWFLYADDDRRAVASFGSQETRFIYSDWQVMEERDGADAVLRQYVDGRSLDEHLQITHHSQDQPVVYYYHSNAQDSVGALTNVDGQIVEYYEYRWLGSPIVLDNDGSTMLSQSKIGNPYRFQGRRYDEASGLYYYRHRYYSPDTGDFLIIDPLGNWHHGQGNGFSAFGEDAWNRADPLGLGDRIVGHRKLTAGDFKGKVPNKADRQTDAEIACRFEEMEFTNDVSCEKVNNEDCRKETNSDCGENYPDCYRCIAWYVRIVAEAVMNQEKSWNAKPGDAAILQHEQGHFDIAAYYALRYEHYVRRLRGYGTRCGEEPATIRAMNDLKHKRTQLLAKILAEHSEAQKKYDTETSHGTIAPEQARWNAHIRRTLSHQRPSYAR